MRTKIRGLTRRKGDEIWSFDFIIRGYRFCGSTGRASRREAEAWLQKFRAQKQAELDAYNGAAVMSFAMAATRWRAERGQYRADLVDVDRFLDWLAGEIGERTAITAINDNLVARLVARRRAEGVSNGTVNRSVVEILRPILNRAALWGQPVQRIDWRQHKLKEAPERVREASLDEEARLFAALRPDFHDIVRFLIVQGLRRAEACNLEWSDVDLATGMATIRGKGDTLDRRPLGAAALAIVRAQAGRHPTRVFTYVIRHVWGAAAKGKRGSRRPINPDTLSTAYWRARKAAGLDKADLKLHDMRHTGATRVLRATGNLMAAQKMLGHKRITTTQRYAHMVADDVRAALDAAAPIAVVVTAGAPTIKKSKRG